MRFPARPPSLVIPARAAHLAYLADRMREEERRQYVALTGQSFDPDAVVAQLVQKHGPKLVVIAADGEPAVAGGFEPVIPGVWQAWMIGTDRGWGEWRTITKATRYLMGQLLASGARRLQTVCLSERSATAAWFEKGLGMHHEGAFRAFGVNGEDMLNFAYVKEG